MPQCSMCHKEVPRSDFAKAQLKKSPDHRKCKTCVAIHLESSEHTASSNRNDETTPMEPPMETSVKKETTEILKESTTPATLTDPSDTESVMATIAKLKQDLEKAQQTIKDQQIAHEQKVKQLEAKANQGFQGMERAKETIVHLESLAVEAVNGLKAVQEQASAEIDLLRKKLAMVEAERDDLLAKASL